MRTMVCLEVLDERGLIQVEQTTDHLRIALCGWTARWTWSLRPDEEAPAGLAEGGTARARPTGQGVGALAARSLNLKVIVWTPFWSAIRRWRIK